MAVRRSSLDLRISRRRVSTGRGDGLGWNGVGASPMGRGTGGEWCESSHAAASCTSLGSLEATSSSGCDFVMACRMCSSMSLTDAWMIEVSAPRRSAARWPNQEERPREDEGRLYSRPDDGAARRPRRSVTACRKTGSCAIEARRARMVVRRSAIV